MDPKYSFDTIAPAEFNALLAKYKDIVPSKLTDLDKERYFTIPDLVEELDGHERLSKDQLATLVDWKLSRGKFRPTLKALVQQNSEADVQSITGEGFETYIRGFRTFDVTNDFVKQSLAILTRLKGIGPATASLLLSVCDPVTAPFFSDELFRWCLFQDGKGNGWDRGIKYNVKEYLELFDQVLSFSRRFMDNFQADVTADDVEKVAYVLGNGGAGVLDGGHSESKRKPSQKRKAVEEVDSGLGGGRRKASRVQSKSDAIIVRAKANQSESSVVKKGSGTQTATGSRQRRKPT